MSEFFRSEMVQEELREIERLQEKVFGNIFTFQSLPRDEQLEQVKNLEILLNKQNVFYTRLRLSDDPQAKEMKAHLQIQAQQLGFPPDVDLGNAFKNMFKMVEQLRNAIDVS